MSLFNGLRSEVAGAANPAAATTNPAATERKKTEFWLNIGVVLEGQGEPDEHGKPTDLFISLPFGLPLDDMKDQPVKGTNANAIRIAQARNALLKKLRAGATQMVPGSRMIVPGLTVEALRIAAPEQEGTAESNNLIAALDTQFGL